MSSKAVHEPREEAPTPGWQAPTETAPSAVRTGEPRVLRYVAFICFLVLIVSLGAFWANLRGRQNLIAYLFGPGWATVLFVVGLAGLLLHAAVEQDLQYRRSYGAFGLAWLAAGVIVTLVPYHDEVTGLFLPYGLICFWVALFFILPFARNETDPQWSEATARVVGGVGALLALAGLIGGMVDEGFLFTRGLPLALLGLAYVWAFIGLEGGSSDRGYWAAFALGAVGLVVFLVALGRSLLPPLFYSWGWLYDKPGPYLVPQGLLLMLLGLVYLGIGLGTCSESRFLVLFRRELASFFYSPVAYIVILGMAAVGWYQYLQFVVWVVFVSEQGGQPVLEPIVQGYILDWPSIIAIVCIVPVLTMRLFSEERRSGTLEVLFTAPVGEVTVVLSKFCAAFLVFLLVWLPWGLFLIDLRVEGGRPFDYRPMLSFYLALAATGASFVSMGVFFSSLTRSQIAAAILTFVGMVFWTMPFFLNRLLYPGAEGSVVLNYLSYISLWMNALRGLVIPRFLIFQLSATFFWLYLTVKVLEARKWA